MPRPYDDFAKRLTDHVCNYIDFLSQQYGYMITLHHSHNNYDNAWVRMLKYNYHQCALCQEIKVSSEAWQHCIERQRKVQAKAIQAPYIGTCYAGVTECVFPIIDIEGTSRGFICVSGYIRDLQDTCERVASAAAKYNLPLNILCQAVEKLNPQIPNLDELSVQIAPIQDALSGIISLNSISSKQAYGNSKSEILYHQMTTYINGNYRSQDFNLQSVCDAFSVSYSYASHLFTQFNPLTFNSYVRQLRVETAKKYLEYTNEPIIIVAFEVGFSDSNYFSTVFHSATGMSAMEWRRKYGSLEFKDTR